MVHSTGSLPQKTPPERGRIICDKLQRCSIPTPKQHGQTVAPRKYPRIAAGRCLESQERIFIVAAGERTFEVSQGERLFMPPAR
jgi:hypothetical protein